MAQPALFREARRLATRPGIPEYQEYQFEITPGRNLLVNTDPEEPWLASHEAYENTR